MLTCTQVPSEARVITSPGVVDQTTGKSIAYIQQGAAYNQDIDYIFTNEGIVKRYTTEELIEKAFHIKEMLK